jgi:Replication-relaxation
VSSRSSGRVESPAALGQVAGGLPAQFANDCMDQIEGEVMSGRYVTAERLAAVNEALTDRDWTVLTAISRVKVATGYQLERLCFDDPETDRTAVSRQRRRALSRLVELEVLARLDRRIGGVRAGSAGFVYGLGLIGQRLLAARTVDGASRWRRPWTPGLSFLQHRLAITELYVRLVEAERAGELDLIDFSAEPDCWRSFFGRGGARVWLKPDAYVRVATGFYEYLWFVEVDRGAESRPVLKTKCGRYIDYWLSGREDTHTSVFPAVLWLVPDVVRAEILAQVIEQLPKDARQLFQIGLFDQAVETLSGRGDANPAA